jgi:hypothetical protein
VLTGSCLCGAVRYAIREPLQDLHHCHCSRCRKAHGAAFATYAGAPAAAFEFTAGAGAVRRFRSSPEVERSFCATCGSNLTFRSDLAKDRVWVAAGTIDGDPGLRPQLHIFAASKAPWHEILDGLPQHAEYPNEGA